MAVNKHALWLVLTWATCGCSGALVRGPLSVQRVVLGANYLAPSAPSTDNDGSGAWDDDEWESAINIVVIRELKSSEDGGRDEILAIRAVGVGGPDPICAYISKRLTSLLDIADRGFITFEIANIYDFRDQKVAAEIVNEIKEYAETSPTHVRVRQAWAEENPYHRAVPPRRMTRRWARSYGKDSDHDPVPEFIPMRMITRECENDLRSCPPATFTIDANELDYHPVFAGLVGRPEHLNEMILGARRKITAVMTIDRLREEMLEENRWGFRWRKNLHGEDLELALRKVRRSNANLRQARQQLEFIAALNALFSPHTSTFPLEDRIRQLETMVHYNNLCAHYLRSGKACPRSQETQMMARGSYYKVTRWKTGLPSVVADRLAEYDSARVSEEGDGGTRDDSKNIPKFEVSERYALLSAQMQDNVRAAAIDGLMRRWPISGSVYGQENLDIQQEIEGFLYGDFAKIRAAAIAALEDEHGLSITGDGVYDLLTRSNVFYTVSRSDNRYFVTPHFFVTDEYVEVWDWKRRVTFVEIPEGLGLIAETLPVALTRSCLPQGCDSEVFLEPSLPGNMRALPDFQSSPEYSTIDLVLAIEGNKMRSSFHGLTIVAHFVAVAGARPKPQGSCVGIPMSEIYARIMAEYQKLTLQWDPPYMVTLLCEDGAVFFRHGYGSSQLAFDLG